jgi:hypothetical protein
MLKEGNELDIVPSLTLMTIPEVLVPA